MIEETVLGMDREQWELIFTCIYIFLGFCFFLITYFFLSFLFKKF